MTLFLRPGKEEVSDTSSTPGLWGHVAVTIVLLLSLNADCIWVLYFPTSSIDMSSISATATLAQVSKLSHITVLNIFFLLTQFTPWISISFLLNLKLLAFLSKLDSECSCSKVCTNKSPDLIVWKWKQNGKALNYDTINSIFYNHPSLYVYVPLTLHYCYSILFSALYIPINRIGVSACKYKNTHFYTYPNVFFLILVCLFVPTNLWNGWTNFDGTSLVGYY